MNGSTVQDMYIHVSRKKRSAAKLHKRLPRGVENLVVIRIGYRVAISLARIPHGPQAVLSLRVGVAEVVGVERRNVHRRRVGWETWRRDIARLRHRSLRLEWKREAMRECGSMAGQVGERVEPERIVGTVRRSRKLAIGSLSIGVWAESGIRGDRVLAEMVWPITLTRP